MLTAIIFAAALAQSSPASTSVYASDVAYAELSAGDAAAAVRKLETVARDSSDPALLINLGTAYERQGATDKALVAYRSAMASDERYEFELADGSWMDSHEAARQALMRLQRARAQAMR